MLALLQRFCTSSIHLTRARGKQRAILSSLDGDDERIVDFFDAKIVFPDWNPEIEDEIREQLSQLRGLDDAGKAAMARTLIVEHLGRDNPRNIPFADRSAALQAVSAHTWKVARARGIVCER
jgi:hypothetical protein